jgi:hypothetical protein
MEVGAYVGASRDNGNDRAEELADGPSDGLPSR